MKKGTKVKQRDITDCGAACLASVAAHYALHLPVSRIRQMAGTDRRGTNVMGLVEAAEKLGFQAKGAKGTIESLSKIPLPAIAHVIINGNLHHYVVIYKVSKKAVLLMDPGEGRIYKKPIADFKKEWSGVIVLLVPDDEFVKGKQRISNTTRFWQLIKPHSGIMVQAMLGALVYTILGLSTSIYVQKIIDFVLVEGNLRLLNLLSVIMIVILVFQLLIGGIKSMFALRTGQHIDARLILGYYKHLLNLPQRFFDTMRVGEIISRVNDAVKIRMFINEVALSIIVNILIVGFSIALMFLWYWKLALIMLAIVPVYVITYFISNRLNKKWQRTLMENAADLESQLVESLNAAGTIKRFGIEQHASLKTENRFIIMLRSIYKTSVFGIYLGTATEFFTRLFTIIILWAGSYFVVSRELSPGELLSFYALIGYFTGPAASLISANKSIQDALIAADRLFEIIDLETESSDEDKYHLSREAVGDIQFQDVSFRYGTRTMVFENLNLVITKGKTTAIAGESGSGKSTLMSILQNLYPVSKGNVLIGDAYIRNISNRSLREIVGVVPQHTDMFAGSIIENIALGEAEPDIQRILMLSHKLGINEFVEKLPGNYNTVLNEHGYNLSGGERQRISIARALYRLPEILIMDEATSNLDPIAEKKVQETLGWYKETGKTIIVIAHRLTTIRNADMIVVLSKGKVEETGTHNELLLKNGLYASLWRDYQTT